MPTRVAALLRHLAGLSLALALGLAVGFAWHWSLQAPRLPQAGFAVTAQAAAVRPARPEPAVADATTNQTTQTATPAPASAVRVQPVIATSLRGSDIDGAMTLDPTGQLQLDRELRRLFDYLLAAASEQPIALLRARLQTLADAQGGPMLAAQALSAFDQYLSYLRAESELARQSFASLRDRLDALSALRRSMLGTAVAEAYFGDEERLAETTLQRAEDTPSAPSPLASELAPQALALEQTAQFEQLQLSAEQRWAEREALYGADAADRLAQLDAEHARWATRLTDWQQRRDALLANPQLDARQREQALLELMNSLFDPAEQRRVLALQSNP